MSARHCFSRLILTLVAACSLQSAQLWAADPTVVATPVKYEVTVDDTLPAVQAMLISALEARNYAVINQLDVQEGLASRGIEAHPLRLVEFCHLTRA